MGVWDRDSERQRPQGEQVLVTVCVWWHDRPTLEAEQIVCMYAMYSIHYC